MLWTLLFINSMQTEADRMRLSLGHWRWSTLHPVFWGQKSLIFLSVGTKATFLTEILRVLLAQKPLEFFGLMALQTSSTNTHLNPRVPRESAVSSQNPLFVVRYCHIPERLLPALVLLLHAGGLRSALCGSGPLKLFLLVVPIRGVDLLWAGSGTECFRCRGV